MTPNEVRRKYSKGRCLLTVLRKGYRYKGMCAAGGDRKTEMINKFTNWCEIVTIAQLNTPFMSFDLVS